MKEQKSSFKLQVHSTVFWSSAGLTAFFVAFSLFKLPQMKQGFEAVQHAITANAGWFFIAAVNIYLGIVIYLLLSRYGGIRLGGPDSQPEFSTAN